MYLSSVTQPLNYRLLKSTWLLSDEDHDDGLFMEDDSDQNAKAPLKKGKRTEIEADEQCLIGESNIRDEVIDHSIVPCVKKRLNMNVPKTVGDHVVTKAPKLASFLYDKSKEKKADRLNFKVEVAVSCPMISKD